MRHYRVGKLTGRKKTRSRPIGREAVYRRAFLAPLAPVSGSWGPPLLRYVHLEPLSPLSLPPFRSASSSTPDFFATLFHHTQGVIFADIERLVFMLKPMNL